MLIESLLTAFANSSAGNCPVCAPMAMEMPPINPITLSLVERIIEQIIRCLGIIANGNLGREKEPQVKLVFAVHEDRVEESAVQRMIARHHLFRTIKFC